MAKVVIFCSGAEHFKKNFKKGIGVGKNIIEIL